LNAQAADRLPDYAAGSPNVRHPTTLVDSQSEVRFQQKLSSVPSRAVIGGGGHGRCAAFELGRVAVNPCSKRRRVLPLLAGSKNLPSGRLFKLSQRIAIISVTPRKGEQDSGWASLCFRPS
jgi:hypothetical protein